MATIRLYDKEDMQRKGVGHDKLIIRQENVEYERQPHTVLLSDYLKQSKEKSFEIIKLVNCDGTEVVEVDKFPAILGSMKDKCSVAIDDFLVSRIHCCITKEKEGFMVEDMNSTNGTGINGETLLPGEKRCLRHGDRLMMATRFYKVEML